MIPHLKGDKRFPTNKYRPTDDWVVDNESYRYHHVVLLSPRRFHEVYIAYNLKDML